MKELEKLNKEHLKETLNTTVDNVEQFGKVAELFIEKYPLVKQNLQELWTYRKAYNFLENNWKIKSKLWIILFANLYERIRKLRGLCSIA